MVPYYIYIHKYFFMFKHTIKISLGVILIIIGLIGGLIPIFQGWIFGIPGLIILSNYFPPAKRLLIWAKKRLASIKTMN